MYQWRHKSVCILIYIPLCIYFNFSKVSKFPMLLIIYIPLCIYFNKKWLQIFCSQLHLHSTMYLFQLVNIPLLPNSPKPFTFHYVSISTRISKWHFIGRDNLHSTMYLFQPIDNSPPAPAMWIYIPLCIYFNVVQSITLAHSFSHLHSTMYLFQRAALTYALSAELIYIPLCIYFNLSSITWCYRHKCIYIPLCIYFNKLCLIQIVHPYLIYIPLCIYFNRRKWTVNNDRKGFTFHYVSISTNPWGHSECQLQ